MKSLLAICVINALVASVYALSPSVALGVKVVDDEENPLSGIPVACIFPDRTRLGDEDYSIVTNRTGGDGMTRFKGRSYNGWVDYGMIKKEGYYPIGAIRTDFTNISGLVIRKWLPYDEVQTITLQKIGKKIPLFVKEAYPKRKQDLTATSDRKFCYDLVKGDWMPPFGKGEHADIEFQLLPRKDFGVHIGLSGIPGQSYRDEITMRFTGKDNGIVPMIPPPNAVLKIREAPFEGYEQQSVSWSGRDKNIQPERSDNKEKCQAFRIRTIKDADGKINRALYGKVYGGFLLTYKVEDHPSGVSFTYYLNLTPNDRNLEWDMEHNLCPVRNSFNQP